MSLEPNQEQLEAQNELVRIHEERGKLEMGAGWQNIELAKSITAANNGVAFYRWTQGIGILVASVAGGGGAIAIIAWVVERWHA